MIKEVEVIRYLLDEIIERKKEIEKYKKEPHGIWYSPPEKSLIIDNAKKIRLLALKIRKEGEKIHE